MYISINYSFFVISNDLHDIALKVVGMVVVQHTWNGMEVVYESLPAITCVDRFKPQKRI